ncbi:hypothetical protein PHYPSEUDO_002696 [Phytophthora pseudosyringae]|uniref:Uncharacterized protein n=1 Tax=Phytophthora pseudosyringae TaxID=221518 RepID=A0A8T1WIW3_9STRA|nr:hypothetical protein PHYPSEUDO_002696 [Phytophthora pseudosyringae]
MSVASWYYCNLLEDEVSAEVPVVQGLQSAVRGDLKVPAVRPSTALAWGAEVDDELTVGRSTYVLSAACAATPNATEKVEAEPVAVEAVEVESSVPEQEPAEPVVTEAVAEAVEVVERENVEPVEEEEEVEKQEAATEAAAQSIAVEEETIAEAKETVREVATAHEAVETPAVVEDEETPVDVEQVAHEPVPEPDQKLADKAEDVTLVVDPEPRKLVTRMASIPEDDESVRGVDDDVPADENVTEDVVVEETEELVEAVPAEEVAATKPVSDDESETETQSEISEATATEATEAAPVAKVLDEPESEIDETMVIDPAVATKEAVAQTSPYSFIPEPIRKNGYAVSSVAVAVATAIAAALVARR